jgi:hypothetical protein
MKKQLELLSGNSQKGAAFWPTLLLILVILGLPFGIGFFLGRAGGASSVQVTVPKPTAEDPGQLKMVQPRWGHTATVLASGRILIQGGYKTAPSGNPAQAEPAELTEIFDPLTQRFALAQEADLAEAGQQTWPSVLETPSSIPLANGGSLIFGLDGVFLELTGASSMVSLTSLWDTNVPSLLRYGGTAIPLNGTYANPDGTTTTYEFNHRILVVGGLDAAGNPQDAAVFNPAKLRPTWMTTIPVTRSCSRVPVGLRMKKSIYTSLTIWDGNTKALSPWMLREYYSTQSYSMCSINIWE